MHNGTNKILPNMCAWAHLKANWLQIIYLGSFHFFAQIVAGKGRHCCKCVWKLVAGTQTVLLATSMGRNAHGFSIAQTMVTLRARILKNNLA